MTGILSREARENKNAYNREYVKKYRKDNDLVAFNTYLPREVANEIKEYLKYHGFNKKDFILSSYYALIKEYFEMEKY